MCSGRWLIWSEVLPHDPAEHPLDLEIAPSASFAPSPSGRGLGRGRWACPLGAWAAAVLMTGNCTVCSLVCRPAMESANGVPAVHGSVRGCFEKGGGGRRSATVANGTSARERL